MWWNNYDGLHITKSDVEKIKAIPTNRTIICSNHSHRHDAIFLFSLSAILKEQFNYIAAREIFDWWPFGMHGYCIQRVGAYSITRGSVDRASIAMSKKLIVEGKRKLVVFPECEISGSDDMLLPVEPGLASLFYKGLEELKQVGSDEPLFVLPIGLKYKYVSDISQNCGNALTRIENTLGVEALSKSLPERFNAALGAYINLLASEYRFGHANWAKAGDRVDFDSAIAALIEYCSDCVGIDPATENAPQAVHTLRNQLRQFLKVDGYVSPYRARIHKERRRYLLHFDCIFDTILRLAALKEFRVLSGMSQENLASGIDLLERELFGKATQKGSRIVYIKAGDPINIADRFNEYQKDKKREVDWLTSEIERQLRDMLGITEIDRKVA